MTRQVLEQAKEDLEKIDNRIDQLEGENVHAAILEIQDLLMEWNVIGHNFATNGIQDYIKSDNREEK